jgi:hypothetical protein
MRQQAAVWRVLLIELSLKRTPNGVKQQERGDSMRQGESGANVVGAEGAEFDLH